ncbi:hypothetical protein [Streptomyces microflavus]|uniref:hypothetical protein n=1 Tax=Streptomyces microflavus TaxID=1919 RepID=UPI003403D79D
MLGILVATTAGVLTYRAQQDPATTALAAGGAFAGGVLFFQKIVPDSSPGRAEPVLRG